jgi:diguanylate cyclase (GGDEF)-like protein/PAS domain S-box-containing protein
MKKTKPDLHLVGFKQEKHGHPPGGRESFYRLLFDSSNDAILFHGFDAEGFPSTFVDANDTACRRLGYSREELLRLSPYDIDDPSSNTDMAAVMERIRTHEQVMFERIHVARDGRRIPVEISARLIEMDGQPMMLSIVRDISERKQAEAQVHLASEQLEAVFSNVHALIAYMDADFNFIRVNRPYAEADGREPEFFVGKNHFALYPHAENQAVFRRVLETGEPYHAYAKPFAYPDHPELGTTYWDWTLSPVKEQAGKVTGLILSLVDVTENRLAWLALEENQKNLSAIFDAISESVLLMDLDGKVLSINQTGARRLKLAQHEVIGRNLFDLIPAKVAEQRRKWIEEIRRDRKPLHVEDERNGIYFEHSLYPVFDAAGEVARYVVYATDVTERRQLELIENLLAECNQKVLQGEKSAELLTFICTRVAALLDFPLVWIGQKQAGGLVEIIASAGEAVDYREELKQIGVRWDDSPQGMGPAGQAIRVGQVKVTTVNQKGFKPWRAAAEQHGFQAIIAIPLIVRGEIYGVFTLYSSYTETFENQALLQRLNGIAGRICLALEMTMDQERFRLLGAALSSASNAIFIADRNGRIRWINGAFTRLCGYSELEIVGQTPRILKSGQTNPAYYQHLWRTILAGETWSSEIVERRKDGSLYTVQQTITPILDEDGEITHFVAIQEDISAKKRAEERIRYLAQHDVLTDLPNRSLFYDRLHQAMLATHRNHGKLALLYLDLDRFKAVNDTLGHHIGDLLLQAAGLRLKECVRESDTVARLGGDEFAVILPEIATAEDAVKVAGKIIAALTRDFHLDEHVVRIGTSIGVAVYGETELATDELVKRADAAMYAAKKDGGNAYRFAGQD